MRPIFGPDGGDTLGAQIYLLYNKIVYKYDVDALRASLII